MDRDRDRRRDRIPPEDQYGTGRGQSYRPGNVRERTPPSRLGGDSYRARSPPRRTEYMDPYKADTYRAQRGRSRSPPPRREDGRISMSMRDDPLRRDDLRRDDRLPLRDDERRPLPRDDFRCRSPSAARFRDERVPRGGDSYRGRPRTPPARRSDLPRDDLFRREPVRDERDFRDRDPRDYREERDRDRAYDGHGPSPVPRYRDRSEIALKRGREPSPISSRGRRTPPPPKRERLGSPVRPRYEDDYPPSRGISSPRRRFSPVPKERGRRGYSPTVQGATRNYRLRSRSPLARNERIDPRSVDDWRKPRSPAPRHDILNRDEPAVNSAATSRRSSPPIHPSRLAHLPAEERLPPSRASPRNSNDIREPQHASDLEPREIKETSTSQAGDTGFVPQSHPAERQRDPGPPSREPRRDDDVQLPVRAPPTGPGGQRGTTAMAPPTGPAAAQVTAPSGPRAVSGGPPLGPRGGLAPRGDYAPRGRGSFGGDFAPRGRGGYGGSLRGARGGGPLGFGRGSVEAGVNRSVSENFSPPAGAAAAGQPPSGPRGSFPSGAPPTFPRQASVSSATTTFQPRPPRFGGGLNGAGGDTNLPDVPTGPKALSRKATDPMIPTGPANHAREHAVLADLPKVVEGGQKLESVVDRSKLTKLEDEAERLKKQIEEKEARKRKNLKEWERMSRETEAAAVRSALAEQALRSINGEAESQAAF